MGDGAGARMPWAWAWPWSACSVADASAPAAASSAPPGGKAQPATGFSPALAAASSSSLRGARQNGAARIKIPGLACELSQQAQEARPPCAPILGLSVGDSASPGRPLNNGHHNKALTAINQQK